MKWPYICNPIYIIGRNCWLGRLLWVFNKCSGLRPSDTLSSCWLDWRRHARTGKQLFVKSYDLPFQSVTVFILAYVCLYWIKGIFWGYAIRSGRHPSGSQRPAVGPAATDFPRDVCLTVSRNHKVLLLDLDSHFEKKKLLVYETLSETVDDQWIGAWL